MMIVFLSKIIFQLLLYITFISVIFVSTNSNDMKDQTEIRILVDDLIKILDQQVKKGVTSVTIKGTILSPEDGNSVLVSTERQM